MTLSRDALRPWATSAAVSRELRAMLAADAHQLGAEHGARVFLVLLGGAFAPESIPAAAWRTVEGHRVAVVALETARDIATGRSSSAAAALTSAPPARGVWCLALAADGSALTWSTPVTFAAPAGVEGGGVEVDGERATVAYLAARRRFPGGDA